LVVANAKSYVYPLLTATIIFVAVLIDTLRTGTLARLRRRAILATAEETLSSAQRASSR
jgi:hypothetical protein